MLSGGGGTKKYTAASHSPQLPPSLSPQPAQTTHSLVLTYEKDLMNLAGSPSGSALLFCPPLRSSGQYGEMTFVPLHAIACKQSISYKSKRYGLTELVAKCLVQGDDHNDHMCKYTSN